MHLQRPLFNCLNGTGPVLPPNALPLPLLVCNHMSMPRYVNSDFTLAGYLKGYGWVQGELPIYLWTVRPRL